MAHANNTAIYLDSNGELSIRTSNDVYIPAGSQSLVRVAYSAINPADLKHYFMGMSEFVAGYEWLGSVVEAGPTSPFKVGQRLFGVATPGDKRPLSAGAHQDYLLAETQWTYALPPGLDEQTAVSFLVAAQTSADALFNVLGFAFPPAHLPGDDPAEVPFLIWGGGSALGQAAIQLAKAAGFSPIITTASPRNHFRLKDLGATHCFDYHSDNVEDEIRAAVSESGKLLTTVYDPVAAGLGFAEGLSPAEQKVVASHFDFSTVARARRCCAANTSLKLCAALIVENDPDWGFPMPYRLATDEQTPSPRYLRGIEGLVYGADRAWGDRINSIREWCLRDGAKNWKPISTKIIHGADAAIAAIKDVSIGKAGGDKHVIQHPLSVIQSQGRFGSQVA